MKLGRADGQPHRGNDAYAYTAHPTQDLVETSKCFSQITAQGATGASCDAESNVSAIGGASYGYKSQNRMNNAGGVPLASGPAGQLFYVGTSP